MFFSVKFSFNMLIYKVLELIRSVFFAKFRDSHAPWIGTNDNRMEQCPVNMAGGAELPISAFPNKFSRLSQHGVLHCHEAKLLCRDEKPTFPVFVPFLWL